jgi:hypothetical protein
MRPACSRRLGLFRKKLDQRTHHARVVSVWHEQQVHAIAENRKLPFVKGWHDVS